MRVLVLGRSGQVGRELEWRLSKTYEVVSLGREDLDLSQRDSIAKVVRAAHPAAIINAAAYTAVDASESDESTAWTVNAVAPGILAREAAALGVPFFHYSTDYVFDGAKSGAYTEDDATHPLGVYGRTKLAGEEAVRLAAGIHFILRTSWVYGDHGRNFMLTMLKLARERPELRVVHDQTGVPNWSRHIAHATGDLLDQGARLRRLSGTYHLSSQGSTSWHGFATAIIEMGSGLGLCPSVPVRAITTAEYPTPTRRPPNSTLDSELLAQRAGISLPDWREGLRTCLQNMASASVTPASLTAGMR